LHSEPSATVAAEPALADQSTSETGYEAALEVLRGVIAGGGWALCLAHIQPDGDALGSAIALALTIRRAGGCSVVSFDPGPLPFGMPASLRFLPGKHLLADPDRIPSGSSGPSAVITFDTGSAERLGRLARFTEVGSEGPPVLVIDHHARGTVFGGVRLVEADAAATAEIVAMLIDGLGIALDAEIATCLYTGLASDTGSFRYAATSAHSHRLASRLLDAGIRHDEISKLLWDTRPSSYLSVLTAALQRLNCDNELIWTYVEMNDLATAGATAEEAEGIVDVIRVAREHDVAVVLKEDLLDGQPGWKASVRSRGRVDVGAACTALGGGGHRFAAGFSAFGRPAEIIARLRAVLQLPG
jgi:phosphoesterase RecJ-like protein